ncbi:MAG: hypothetical protein OXT67_08260 [Zetaproteobacteria bacterium]|nr:hypothetical protein [Zetaproteobacteria bacterium]
MQTNSVWGWPRQSCEVWVPRTRRYRLPLKTCELSIEQASEIAHPYLSQHLESTTYDRIDYFYNIIKSFRNDPKPFPIKPKHLRMSAKIDLAKNSAGLPGGNCIFLTSRLNAQLPEILQPNIVKSRILKKHQQKGFPSFCHSATLIKCQDGCLLLDSGYGIARPIQLKPNGASDAYHMGPYTWTYRLNRRHSKIIWEVYSQEGKLVESTFYSIKYANCSRQLHNDISTAIVYDGKPICVFRDQDGRKTAHVKVDLWKKEITITPLWKNLPPSQISFQELAALPWERKVAHLNQYIDLEFCQRVQLDQEKFTRMVACIVDNDDFIEQRILTTARQSSLSRYADRWVCSPWEWFDLSPSKLQAS